MAGPLETASVRRVAEALARLGAAHAPVALAETARSAEDAARAVGCPLGAIVKSLVFESGGRAVMALVSGDRRCDTGRLAEGLGLDGPCRRADADLVRAATGFAIGGVAPVGHPAPLPVAIDPGLGRFETIWAAAGHPHAVFRTSYGELARLASARPVEGLGA